MFNKKQKYEYEFLPSALEIEETPPSPLGKFIVWTVFIIIIIAVAWSILAKTDKVAVARGKIIPVGKAKVIEPFEDGIVKGIYVKEGQKVKKGQLLISLDSTITDAETREVREYLSTLKLEEYLLKRQLNKSKLTTIEIIHNKKEFKYLTIAQIDFHLELQDTRETEYKEKEIIQNHIIIQREAELEIAATNLAKMKQRVKVLQNQENMYKKLSEKGSVSKQTWIDKKSEVDSLKYEIKAQIVDKKRNSNQIDEANNTLNLIHKQWRTGNLKELVETEKKIRAANSRLIKAERKLFLRNLYSPVDGIVNQLEVTTIGEVVTPAQPIITIVPQGMAKVAEVSILNRDIGFIHNGQSVELKLDTFPFTRYGVIEAKVINISPDAVVDQKTGSLTYEVLVKPNKNKILVGNKYINLTPGMTLTAEIKIGTRRVIDFFLDPIMKFKGEVFKMR